jgi:hypothetical protein
VQLSLFNCLAKGKAVKEGDVKEVRLELAPKVFKNLLVLSKTGGF